MTIRARPHPFVGDLHADAFSVQKLLQLARDGRLRVPSFQRPLRWSRRQDLDLLDSLYRSYPIGTLLLWERPADEGLIQFGAARIEASARTDALWIVDGQQRLDAIVGAMLHPRGAQSGRTNGTEYGFDLDGSAFVQLRGDVPPHIVPVNRLANPVDTSRWARETDASDARHDAAQEVSAALLGYQVPAYTTSAPDDAVLRRVFTRLNTAGTPMREEEVFHALHRPREGDASVTDPLIAASRAERFGSLDPKTAMKILLAVADRSPRSGGSLHDPPDAMQRHVEPATAALQRAIALLRDEANIPHLATLPGDLPLVALSHLFHRFPDPRERSIELLVRQVWRSIAADAVSLTNEHLHRSFRAVRDSEEEEEAVQALLGTAPREPVGAWGGSPVLNRRGRATRMELCWLAGLDPRELDETPVDLSLLFEDPDAHDPAEAPPRWSRLTGRSSVATVVLAPGVTARQLASASADVLRSHALDEQDRGELAADQVEGVIERRRARIIAGVDRLIQRHARWGDDDDGPSLEYTLLRAELA